MFILLSLLKFLEKRTKLNTVIRQYSIILVLFEWDLLRKKHRKRTFSLYVYYIYMSYDIMQSTHLHGLYMYI